MHSLRVAGVDRDRDRRLAVEVAAIEHAHQAEVEEADAAVVEQQVVAGVRVAGDAACVVHEPEVEAEDDLGEPVARRLVELLDRPEARAGDQVGDEHAPARELGVDLGHVRERMPAVGARDGAVVLRLELVVELLGDPLAQLRVHRLDVQAGREPLDERQQQGEVAQVGVDRLGHAGVLHLDRHVVPFASDRTVHLADRRGGERLLVELREDDRGLVAQLLAQQLRHLLERQRRDVVAQLRERLLEALALVLGQRGEVDRREHLPDLHRRPAHLAELLDELARERGGALAGGGVGALGRAHDVRGARADPARGLPGDQAAEACRAREARRRRLAWVVRHRTQATAMRGGGPVRRATIRYKRPMIRAFGPGRVNLIGEHTDYNGGLALPFAIDRGVTVEAEPLAGGEMRAEARDLGESDAFDAAAPGRAEGWRAFVRGTVAELRAAGVEIEGARLAFAGDVPQGSGLSSSAALETALCLALLAVAGAEEPDRTELAKLCSRVENDWVGAQTGLLDQLASLHGRAGAALRIDFATLELRPVPLELGDWRLVTLDSGAEHSHAAGGYNERRAECRAACAALGVEHLSAADHEAAERLPEPLRRRARHVLSENARVDAMVAALGAADLEEAGRLLDASHASLRDDYEASVPAVEAAVARLKSAGAAGARMVGGGFGGSVLALLEPGAEPPPGSVAVAPGPPARRL